MNVYICPRKQPNNKWVILEAKPGPCLSCPIFFMDPTPVLSGSQHWVWALVFFSESVWLALIALRLLSLILRSRSCGLGLDSGRYCCTGSPGKALSRPLLLWEQWKPPILWKKSCSSPLPFSLSVLAMDDHWFCASLLCRILTRCDKECDIYQPQPELYIFESLCPMHSMRI